MKADKNVDEIFTLVEQAYGDTTLSPEQAGDLLYEAKSALLKLLLESLPARKDREKLALDSNWTLGEADAFNTALYITSEAIKRLFE